MTHPRGVVFETPRLYARAWSIDDVQHFFEIYSSPEVHRFLLRPPVQNLDEARERLRVRLDRDLEMPPGYGIWALVRKADEKVVGVTVLKPLPDDDRIETGWHLGREHWGQGYATESGQGALRYGFETLGLDKIYAIVNPENLASIKVCERLGMEFVEVTDRYHNIELNLYGITQAAYRRQVMAPQRPEPVRDRTSRPKA